MPECAPASTHQGQEGLREAGSGAKTGLEEPHGQRSPVTCLALDAKRALCSPSLVPAATRRVLVRYAFRQQTTPCPNAPLKTELVWGISRQNWKWAFGSNETKVKTCWRTEAI